MPKPSAGALLRAMTELTREIDRDLPITAALVLLSVARQGSEGADQGRIQDELEMSTASISRTVQTLGDVHYLKGKEGLKLITREFDPTDNRRRVLKLTPKGTKLLRAVLGALE